MKLKDYMIPDEVMENLHTGIKIARRNSEGKLWVIGGFLYRSFIKCWKGKDLPIDADIDFLAEDLTSELYVPSGWRSGQTRYGNPFLYKGGLRLDLNSLQTFHSITSRGVKPTLENFLNGTPLNIQSIAYDFETKQVVGPIAADAIATETVRVNNMREANYEARQKDISVAELVMKKAESLGFGYELPD